MSLLELRGSEIIRPIGAISLMTEVMRSIPVLMEAESFEDDLTDAHITLETDSLHRSSWETMMVVSQMMSIDRNVIMIRVDSDQQIEGVSMVERILVANLGPPIAKARGVHHDLMLMMESEVDVQHDVRSRKEFDGEVLVMAIGHVADHADLAAIAQLLVNGNSSRDRRAVDGMHFSADEVC